MLFLTLGLCAHLPLPETVVFRPAVRLTLRRNDVFAVSPNSSQVALGRVEVNIRSLPNGAQTLSFASGHRSIEAVAFVENGTAVAFVDSAQGAVELWDVTRRTATRRWCHLEPGVCVMQTVESTLICAGPGFIKILDQRSGSVIRSGRSEAAARLSVSAIALNSQHDKAFVSGYEGHAAGSVLIWSLQDTVRLIDERRFDEPVFSILRHPTDGSLCVGVGLTTRFEFWNAPFDSYQRKTKGAHETADSLAFSPDGTLLVSGGESSPEGDPNGKAIHVWDVRTGEHLGGITGFKSITCVGFSPNGRQLLASGSGEEGAVLQVWNVDYK